jgi:hypothetical protein
MDDQRGQAWQLLENATRDGRIHAIEHKNAAARDGKRRNTGEGTVVDQHAGVVTGKREGIDAQIGRRVARRNDGAVGETDILSHGCRWQQ